MNNEKPYKIEWYYDVLFFALLIGGLSLFLAVGAFLGHLFSAIIK